MKPHKIKKNKEKIKITVIVNPKEIPFGNAIDEIVFSKPKIKNILITKIKKPNYKGKVELI